MKIQKNVFFFKCINLYLKEIKEKKKKKISTFEHSKLQSHIE